MHTSSELIFSPKSLRKKKKKFDFGFLLHLPVPERSNPPAMQPSGSENTGWNAVLMELRSSGSVIPCFFFWERQLYTHGLFNLAVSPRPSGKATSLSVPQSPLQFAMQKLSQSCCLAVPSWWFCARSSQGHHNCYRRQELYLDHSFFPNHPLNCDKGAQRCSGVYKNPCAWRERWFLASLATHASQGTLQPHSQAAVP